jgi:hypothetical protein
MVYIFENRICSIVVSTHCHRSLHNRRRAKRNDRVLHVYRIGGWQEAGDRARQLGAMGCRASRGCRVVGKESRRGARISQHAHRSISAMIKRVVNHLQNNSKNIGVCVFFFNFADFGSKKKKPERKMKSHQHRRESDQSIVIVSCASCSKCGQLQYIQNVFKKSNIVTKVCDNKPHRVRPFQKSLASIWSLPSIATTNA